MAATLPLSLELILAVYFNMDTIHVKSQIKFI